MYICKPGVTFIFLYLFGQLHRLNTACLSLIIWHLQLVFSPPLNAFVVKFDIFMSFNSFKVSATIPSTWIFNKASVHATFDWLSNDKLLLFCIELFNTVQLGFIKPLLNVVKIDESKCTQSFFYTYFKGVHKHLLLQEWPHQ